MDKKDDAQNGQNTVLHLNIFTTFLAQVDYLVEPISIQNAAPSFSFSLDPEGKRAVISTSYTISVTKVSSSGIPSVESLWSTDNVVSNQTTFIVYPANAPALESNTDYLWKVSVTASGGLQASSTSFFSTALLDSADWSKSQWIQAESSYQAAQMRKAFVLPEGNITRARAFFAMPGLAHS